MMAVEEGSVIAGMLVGLNVIDCNLCLKGEDLDKQACFVISSNVNLLISILVIVFRLVSLTSVCILKMEII